MTPTRTVIIMWVLAVLLMGGTATHIEMNATLGENVLLPCNCSKTTDQVSWQDGNIVVNQFYSAKRESFVDDLYKNRSLLFLSSERGNCTLLLLRVSFSDQRRFTCYTFDEGEKEDTEVSLIITERLPYTPTEPLPVDPPSPDEQTAEGGKEEHTGVQAGIPALLVALLLVAVAVIVVLVRRKRHQNIQEEEDVEDLQAGVPMMKNCPV